MGCADCPSVQDYEGDLYSQLVIYAYPRGEEKTRVDALKKLRDKGIKIGHRFRHSINGERSRNLIEYESRLLTVGAISFYTINGNEVTVPTAKLLELIKGHLNEKIKENSELQRAVDILEIRL